MTDITTESKVTKQALMDLHNAMLAYPQVEIEVKHHQVKAIPNSPQGGIYAREVFLPKGTVVVGKIHKYEQLNIVSQGEVYVATEDGGVQHIKAPYTVVSPAGVKRAVVVIEDTVWTTIHGTNEEEVEVIETKFIADSYEQYLEFAKQQLLEGK